MLQGVWTWWGPWGLLWGWGKELMIAWGGSLIVHWGAVGGQVLGGGGLGVSAATLHPHPHAGAPGTLWVGTVWPRSARLHWAPPHVPPDGYDLVYGPPGGPQQVMTPTPSQSTPKIHDTPGDPNKPPPGDPNNPPGAPWSFPMAPNIPCRTPITPWGPQYPPMHPNISCGTPNAFLGHPNIPPLKPQLHLGVPHIPCGSQYPDRDPNNSLGTPLSLVEPLILS